jgi:hypothetical protein
LVAEHVENALAGGVARGVAAIRPLVQKPARFLTTCKIDLEKSSIFFDAHKIWYTPGKNACRFF